MTAGEYHITLGVTGYYARHPELVGWSKVGFYRGEGIETKLSANRLIDVRLCVCACVRVWALDGVLCI